MKAKTKVKKGPEEVMQEYFKEHLLDIVKNEDLDIDTLAKCLKVILNDSILDRSTEDLEFRLTKKGQKLFTHSR